MKTFTRYEKEQGELACRNLPEDFQDFINTTDPLTIYECYEPAEDVNGDLVPYNNRYYIRGVIEADNLTFTELKNTLADFIKEVGA